MPSSLATPTPSTQVKVDIQHSWADFNGYILWNYRGISSQGYRYSKLWWIFLFLFCVRCSLAVGQWARPRQKFEEVELTILALLYKLTHISIFNLYIYYIMALKCFWKSESEQWILATAFLDLNFADPFETTVFLGDGSSPSSTSSVFHRFSEKKRCEILQMRSKLIRSESSFQSNRYLDDSVNVETASIFQNVL